MLQMYGVVLAIKYYHQCLSIPKPFILRVLWIGAGFKQQKPWEIASVHTAIVTLIFI